MNIGAKGLVGIEAEAHELATKLPDIIAQSNTLCRQISFGQNLQRRPGTGTEFWQYRQYQHGDSTSSIDWKQSARSDNAFIREHEFEANRHLWLYLDSSQSMFWTPSKKKKDKFSYGAIFLLALAQVFLTAGDKVGILNSAKPGIIGATQLSPLAEELYLPAEDKLYLRPEIFNSDVIWCSDFWLTPDLLRERLRPIRQHNARVHMLWLIYQSEYLPPYTGSCILEDIEHQTALNLPDITQTTTEYKSLLFDHRLELEKLATEMGGSLVEINLNEDPIKPLYNLLSYLNGLL